MRQEILDRFTGWFHDNDLAEVYGCIDSSGTSKSGRPFLSTTFCRAAVLDGTLEIYGPKFIRVSWMTRYNRLPHKGSEIFKSETEALNWFKEYFSRSK